MGKIQENVGQINFNETNEAWFKLWLKAMLMKRTDRFHSGEDGITF